MTVLVALAKAKPMLLSKMFKVALVGAISTAPPLGLDSTTDKFTVPCTRLFCTSGTANVLLVSPLLKVKVPLVVM